jgi:two-component system KDP operon response regulator KdpE
MAQEKARILVVDDEPRYTWAIQAILQGVGYETLMAADGETAIALAAVEQLDLILLDVKLPDLDGRQVCERIREFSMTPVIMLTAMADERDKVKGLDAGADDYITKPFGAPELLARVRAILRRAQASQMPGPSTVFRADGLEVDLARQRVVVRGQEIGLTPTEYKLLCEFVKQPQRVLVPGYLLERVWGVGYEGEEHILRQVIHRVRRKIEPDPRQPHYIQTKPGMGYMLAVSEQG